MLSTIQQIGEQNDIEVFAKRIKTMMRGGEKLSVGDALALAQFSKVTGLNPFIGECWWIPGSGAMVGIAGARRKDQERAAERGGYSFPNTTVCSPEEAGVSDAELKDVVAAFRTEINDSGATSEYQRLFTATIQALREAGVSDPFSAAKEVCGPRPSWVGYGYSKKSEPSRMNKVQLARKRSEADALKKRIVIPFGAQMAEVDVSPEYVDAESEESPKHTRAESLHDLGFTDEEKHHEIGLGNLEKDYPEKQPVKDNRIFTVAQRQVLIENKLAGNDFAAKGMLGLSNLPQDATEAEILKWGKLYRENRPDPKAANAPTAEEAAQYANEYNQ